MTEVRPWAADLADLGVSVFSAEDTGVVSLILTHVRNRWAWQVTGKRDYVFINVFVFQR